MNNLLAFTFNAAFTALNVVCYVCWGHHWYNLGVAILCGTFVLWCLVKEATDS